MPLRFYQPHRSPLELILRLAVFGTFIGHGTFALLQRPDWAIFLTTVGFGPQTALALMIPIGIIDYLIAGTTLLRPSKPLLIYAALWALLAALMRPLTGQSWLEFIERAANWCAPLALFYLLRAQVLVTPRAAPGSGTHSAV